LVHGLLTCGGPAAERKFRLAERLPQSSLNTAQSDRQDMSALARAVWLGAGRDGCAFERLAWRSAQRIVDFAGRGYRIALRKCGKQTCRHTTAISI
jgi:hypothetical protein